jgi:hypothetical protein
MPYMCIALPDSQQGGAPAILPPFPGAPVPPADLLPTLTAIGDVCLAGTYGIVATYTLLAVAVVLAVGFLLGRYFLRGNIHHQMMVEARTSLDVLEAVDRTRYQRATAWLAALLVVGGLLLISLGITGDVRMNIAVVGEVQTTAPGIGAVFIGLFILVLGRPARRRVQAGG